MIPVIETDRLILCGCFPAALVFVLSGCATTVPVCSKGLAAMNQAELFFGGSLNAAEWQNFIDQEVAPRFPDGFTVIETQGEWRSRLGMISRETGHELLIIFASAREVQTRLQDIREAYNRRYMQESVLLAEIPVCAGF